MGRDFFEIIEHSPEGYSRNQLIRGSKGNIEDFILVKTNPAFSSNLGLENKNIQNEKASGIFPDRIKNLWIENFERISHGGGEVKFEIPTHGGKKISEVIAWSTEPEIIDSLIRDITSHAGKKNPQKEFLKKTLVKETRVKDLFNYELLSDRLREISGADFILLAIYEKETGKIKINTISTSQEGLEQLGEKVLKEIKEKEWTCSSSEILTSETKKLIFKNNLDELLAGSSLEEISGLLSSKIKVGKAGIIEMKLSEDLRACLILIMPPGRNEPQEKQIEDFFSRLDLLLEKDQEIERVRGTEEKYQTIFENSPIGILHFNREGVITACNERFVEIIGSSRKDLLGLNMLRLPDSRVVNAVREALQGKISRFEGEYASVTSNKVTPVRVLFAPVETGGLGGGIGIVEDITKRMEAERALNDRQKKLQTILDTAPIGIGVVADGIIRDGNKKFCKMLGYSREELIGQKTRMLYKTQEDFENTARKKRHQAESRGRWTIEATWQRKDGNTIEVLLNSAFLYPDSPEEGFIFTAMDVTGIKKSEKEKDYAYSMLTSLFKNSPNPITICTEDSYVFVSPATAELIGKHPEELQGRKFSEVLPKKMESQFKKNLEKVDQEGRQISLKERLPTSKGEKVFETWLFPIKNPLGRGLLYGALSIDISDRVKHEEKLDYMSYHDSLTGLKNRAYLEEKIDSLKRNGDLPLSIVIADINGLKIVNDAYGHKMGDRILVRVAGVIEENLRKRDILSRWGGDEFVLLLPRTSRKEAEEVGKQIQDACNREYINGLPISISWGVGEKFDDKKDIETVLKEAEDQMYRNKLSENRSARSAVLSAMLKTLGVKSDETEEHAWRLKKMAWRVGEKVNLPLSERERLTLLVSMHDIGKISIASEILNKPGKLNSEEWEEIKKHPETGFHIANSTGEFAHIAEEILSHHERWDGQGYPRGLKGTQIPLLARILSIVDAYDVMVNGRPYKKPMSQQEAIEEIKRCAGTQFDPDLAKIFIELLEKEEFKQKQ